MPSCAVSAVQMEGDLLNILLFGIGLTQGGVKLVA
jgi:hypothetical protein